MYNYTFEDGLSANEFKKRSAYKNSQGIMYFGSSNGFTYFHPDSIKIDRMPPQIILSHFSMLNEENEKYKNLSNINFLDAIELPFRNADFEIQFAALNYLNSQNNHFKYKLEGYDNDWIDADHSLSARYTNLNHGDYNFMVLASNSDGIWSETPRTLKIIIHPPWWKTIAFKIFIALVAIVLLRLSYRFRFKMLERQKRALEKSVQDRTRELININQLMEQKQEEITVQFEELSKYKNHLESIVNERTGDLRAAKDKAEESDKLKTAFLQNMSHEIRTPLNAIMGFSELMDESFEDKETLINYTTIIKQKGSDLLDIINGILDISKIETGSLGIILENYRLEDLFREIEIFFNEYQQRLNKSHILFILNNQSNLNEVITIDIGKVKQVIINLINNAFKFTHQGKIEFGCTLRGSNHLEFYVSDTGIGIPQDKQVLIFERFRQIDELHFHEGAGLGLSISKGLIELLGGEIWLTSELKKGTTFYFTVPFFIEPLEK
jgi:signal transduction histidine kinase